MRYLFLSLLIVLIAGCGTSSSTRQQHNSAQDGSRPGVLVTAAPYAWVLERLAGDAVQATLLVPPGEDLHTYEPSPRQAMVAAQARLWLQVGEPVEQRIHGLHKDLKRIDLQQGIELLGGHHHDHDHHHDQHDHDHHGHGHGEFDPHTWMSPELMMIQAEHIAAALIDLLPELRQQINERLVLLQQELSSLDQEIRQALLARQGDLVLVSHPALAYFCRSYGLRQLSVEQEGKEPTAKQLAQILAEARQAQIDRVLMIEQHSPRGAQLLAQQLGAELVVINPLSEDYPALMRKLLEAVLDG